MIGHHRHGHVLLSEAVVAGIKFGYIDLAPAQRVDISDAVPADAVVPHQLVHPVLGGGGTARIAAADRSGRPEQRAGRKYGPVVAPGRSCRHVLIAGR